MEFIADFHIHSKYSRATSRDMDIKHIAEGAKLKGITLMGTGDFTHHLWLEELKRHLEDLGNGLFKYQDIYFILTTELSSIYSKKGKTYRIHNMIFAPSFKTVDKINETLARYGNLASDGRPILGLDAAEIARIAFDIDENCMVIPAHCILPNTLIHTAKGPKKIQDILEGKDSVYTHRLNYKKVTNVLRRPYNGKIYHIRPYYFRVGLKTTPEHPFYIIKTYKNCRCINGVYKPNCSEAPNRKRRHFHKYQPEWAQAKKIERGDIIVFPRFRNTKRDIKEIKISDSLKKTDYILNNNTIYPQGSKVPRLRNKIAINSDFCRLAGYFISEGYTNGRDCVAFCFNSDELTYIEDVKSLMRNIFNISLSKAQVRKQVQGVELIYYSEILVKLFSKIFYSEGTKKAYSKSLPEWMLSLPLDKQSEIIKGWWRGDAGYTSSRILVNQMKVLLLRLGIIPSILVDSKDAHKKRGKHIIGKRIINAQYDTFQFSNLSFFEDNYGLLNDSRFKKFKTKLKRRYAWMDEKYIYIPIRDIEISNYEGEVYNLEVEGDNSYVSEFAIVHNCWTPWFALFGSMSGFDRIEDCFEGQTQKIFALETGLSSDPAMNWRLSKLDKFTLISNSDSHSPSKIGREANVFDCELNYKTIREVLRTKDKQRFLYTIEFFPEEGKYHFDGHRLCGVRWSPKETKQLNGKCPKCGKPVTVGVMNRVEQLGDRPEGFVPENAIPFRNLVPLDEIIAEAKGMGKASQAVEREYLACAAKFGTEFNILLKASEEELKKGLPLRIAEGILRVREGKVNIKAGFDGEYGIISIFGDEDKQAKSEEQLSLF
jgi:uncharacterized protein (TIGR00375 family)